GRPTNAAGPSSSWPTARSTSGARAPRAHAGGRRIWCRTMTIAHRQRGLGKELGTILVEAGAGGPLPARTPPDPLLAPLAEEAIRHGLDALCVALPLELCGYVHVSDGCGPRVALRAPHNARISPTDLFDVLSAARGV